MLFRSINDILDISRIESGHTEMVISKFNVNDLVAETVSMILPQATQKNIVLRLSTLYSEISINTDGDKLRHILQNLVSNAVKFTDLGKVEVSVKKNEDKVEIVVSDTGIGISNEHLPYIFDEFRQADGSTSRRFGGTGLGLAIAKKYATLLGCTISVSSVVGKGSEFVLTIPLKYTTENIHIEPDTSRNLFSSPKSVTPLGPLGGNSKTILLVEDSEPAIIQMKDIMEESGFKIWVAHHGEEALKIIEQNIPDAIILDLMMPGVDGFQVLKALREHEKTALVPVLILTAKHITKEELKFLTKNNVHQLIHKGDVNRIDLLGAVLSMVSPVASLKTEKVIPIQTIEGKPLVVVVEDNPDNLITVKALLSDNFTVIEALNAMEGIAMTKKHKPNLIIMDIGLPGIDGIEALKIIRSDKALENIPIIALTASAMIHDREIILAQGFDAYISKPIDDSEFFQTIKKTLYGE